MLLSKAFICQIDVERIMKLFGSSKQQSRKIFKAMDSYYKQELAEKGLINPGTKGVPNAIARKYLSLYGIDETAIRNMK